MTDQTNIGQNISSSVPFSPQADLPPLPPEFQNLTSPQADVKPPQKEQGSAAPAVPVFSNIAAGPKKKFGTGRIIATVLGVLALIGGVGLATYTVSQRQLFQQKASVNCDNICSPEGSSKCQHNSSGQNTGYNCSCTDVANFTCDGGPYHLVWSCSTTPDYGACPTPGPATPTPSPTPVITDCGACFTKTPDYNKLPTQVGPFTASGKLVIYYVGSSTRTAYITTPDGNTQTVTLSSSDKTRVVTDISINSGDTVTIEKIVEPNQGNPACAPIKGPPYLSIGWMPINSDQTCGSGLNGPQTGGQCTPISPIDESANVAWAQAFNDSSFMGKQCWADWQEWTGDYDFDDFFLMYGITETSAPYCSAISVYDTDWNPIYSAELNNLSGLNPGDVIRFAVRGSGSIDKAKFTINATVGEVNQGTVSGDVTDKKPGTDEFYYEYTIPSGTTSISVSGQVHDTNLGWF